MSKISEKERIKKEALDYIVPHRTIYKEVREEGILIITKGEGIRVFDIDGKSYIDMLAGGTRPVAVGYGREKIAKAMYDQAIQMHYFTPVASSTLPAVRLAKKLAEITPGDLSLTFFVCDGSEAVEAAFKLAKQYHFYKGYQKRYKIISRRGAYHGTTMGALSATGAMSPMREIMEPVVPGYYFIPPPYCYRCPFGKEYPNCNLECAQALEEIIQFESPEQIAAFIAEPVMQTGGSVVPPPEYFPAVRSICDQYGILLIVDEVITGFGRTGKMFACEHFNLVPDIMTMAKELTSGYVPLGAAVTKAQIVEPLPIFMHIHTYGAHPVCCAAALANIEIIEEERLVENAATVGKYFLEGLKTLASHPTVGNVRGLGLWAAIEFVKDKKTKQPFPTDRNPAVRVTQKAKELGLLTRATVNAIEFAPPLTIQKGEIDEALSIIDRAITMVEKELGMKE